MDQVDQVPQQTNEQDNQESAQIEVVDSQSLTNYLIPILTQLGTETRPQHSKKPTAEYPYQTQKIMMNDAEEEEVPSPTYKVFVYFSLYRLSLLYPTGLYIQSIRSTGRPSPLTSKWT